MLEVRALSPDEWEITKELRLASLLDAPEAFGGTYNDSSQRDEASWRAWPTSGQSFAAWVGGEPVGLACWYPETEDPKVAHLIAMWVAPKVRGTAAAGALIDAVAQRARQAGNAILELVVYQTNPAARRAYAKYGFTEVGQSEKWPDGILMRFDLS
jgi:ribosomal protein S18 acetylase RimI-like enzyme